MNPEAQHRMIATNGIRLHAADAGPEDGPLVILLHGYPEFWHGWRYQIGPLAEAGYRVVAPDQRGYNLSDKPKDLSAYRLDRLAADVAGLIDAYGREKATLVGHDWGGLVAWAVAVYNPERLERMAVINAPYPPTGIRAVFRDPLQIIRSAYILFFQIPWLPEAILRNENWKLVVEGMRKSSLPGTFSEADFDQYRRAWWRKDAFTSMLNWYRAFIRRPARLPWKPSISIPTLILWGMQDLALSQKLAEASLALCKQGRMVYFENATHWVQHEEAERVNELLLGFLETGLG